MPRGVLVELARIFELGRTWYEDRLALDWQPKSVDEKRALLAAVGLTGSFWAL